MLEESWYWAWREEFLIKVSQWMLQAIMQVREHISAAIIYGVDGWFFESNASLSSSSLEFESDGALW